MKTLLYIAIAVVGLISAVPARAQSDDHRIYYLNSNVAPPWDVTSNEVDMTDVFGSTGWRARNYETVTLSRLFSPSTMFIFMEGGDNNAVALKNFLSANGTALQNWVSNGGRVFINSAPNEGSGFDLGFGVHLNFSSSDYTSASNNGYAVDANHPIFADNLQPVGTSFAGGDAFSHAYLSGNGISPILQDDQGRPVLVELRYGSGLVLLGSMTVDVFQSPWPNSHNLRTNTIWYAATAQLN